MADKLRGYRGFHGWMHHVRDKARSKFVELRESWPKGIGGIGANLAKPDYRRGNPRIPKEESIDDYGHIYRKKTGSEMVRISAAVMGIEFSYAAETAFVSPVLLKIGVDHRRMTMVWALSPILGFLITPFLGSLSDGCRSNLGRRRPFILLLALGILAGLVLVPNGEDFGRALGDFEPSRYDFINSTENNQSKIGGEGNVVVGLHPWGVFFTVLGTVLLDFDADSCQSPARAYLLDVSLPEDHARGLSTFTVMAGLGGFFGYAMGAVNWDVTAIGEYLGGHVRTVFTFITILFVLCVVLTVTSFKEIPLDLLQREKERHLEKLAEARRSEGSREPEILVLTYGSTKESYSVLPECRETSADGFEDADEPNEIQEDEPSREIPSLKEYLLSIVFMPKSLRMVCLTNFFCWMSHVCYSLYFTDFVGESVFDGDPSAPSNSEEYRVYEEGVRFGCWGLSMYSLSCSCYSLVIERLIERFGARKVYVGGLLFYSSGMMLMAATKSKFGVVLFSWTAGVMYSTLFTLPYLLVARYHSTGVFELTKDGDARVGKKNRGLGTDVGIVSSMVFLAQFVLALGMGEVVSWTGTTTSVVCLASVLAFCGALTATRVMYLDL